MTEATAVTPMHSGLDTPALTLTRFGERLILRVTPVEGAQVRAPIEESAGVPA